MMYPAEYYTTQELGRIIASMKGRRFIVERRWLRWVVLDLGLGSELNVSVAAGPFWRKSVAEVACRLAEARK